MDCVDPPGPRLTKFRSWMFDKVAKGILTERDASLLRVADSFEARSERMTAKSEKLPVSGRSTFMICGF